MNLIHLIFLVAFSAVIMALWTTSEATRAMLIVMCSGTAMVAVTLQGLLKLFLLLGEFGDSPSRQTFLRMLIHGSLTLAVVSSMVGLIIWIGFFLLWP